MKKNMKTILLLSCWILVFSTQLSAIADQRVIANKVSSAPVIDGIGTDLAWQEAETIITNDKIAKIPIELQVVFSGENIFLKVQFLDPDENRDHKILEWNPSLKVYRTGSNREDIFAVKWNMSPVMVDLSLNSETPYNADMWLWKAFRTDPMGFADDKQHLYSSVQLEKAKKIITPSGKIMFLSRPSDSGTSAYKDIAYDSFRGEKVVRYEHQQPSGSRADVQAKGVWNDGIWTIEFQRKLQTGHPDDIQFDTKLTYAFGVSRYEIAAKLPNPSLNQPNYESGDISESLTLEFR